MSLRCCVLQPLPWFACKLYNSSGEKTFLWENVAEPDACALKSDKPSGVKAGPDARREMYQNFTNPALNLYIKHI